MVGRTELRPSKILPPNWILRTWSHRMEKVFLCTVRPRYTTVATRYNGGNGHIPWCWATKACGGPLTNEILPNILHGGRSPALTATVDPTGRLDILENFLTQQFHVSASSPPEQYPALPLLMSLIDTAPDRRQAFHSQC